MASAYHQGDLVFPSPERLIAVPKRNDSASQSDIGWRTLMAGMSTQDWATLATAGSAIATLWLAWTTQRVAKATRNAVELQTRPLLSLETVELTFPNIKNLAVSHPVPGIRIGVVLKNPGHVPVDYRLKQASLSFNGSDLPFVGVNSMSGRVFPGQVTTYYYPASAIPASPTPGSEGLFSLVVEYRSGEGPVEQFDVALKVMVLSTSPSIRGQWVFAREPLYQGPYRRAAWSQETIK